MARRAARSRVRDELLAKIVGLTIDVERWDGKFKLSQDRSAEDADRVVGALSERNPTLAAFVSRAFNDRAKILR